MKPVLHIKGDDQPLVWHYFSDLGEAIKTVKAAERLELPFILHRQEEHDPNQESDTETMGASYVVVVLPHGAEIESDAD